MKKGAHVARLKWTNRTRQGKVKIALSPHGVIRTWYLNYHSDNGICSTGDILANDWVVVEPASGEVK